MTMTSLIFYGFSISVLISTIVGADSKVSAKKYLTGCTDEICREAGESFFRYVNDEVNPCDNFYEHACGNWNAKHPISGTNPIMNQRELEKSKIDRQLRELLEESVSNSDIDAIRKAKMFYKSCMDLDRLERRGLEPLNAILKANDEWPLMNVPVDINDKKNMTWLAIHESIAKTTGISTLFESPFLSSVKQVYTTRGIVTFFYEDRRPDRFRTRSISIDNSTVDYVTSVVEAFSESRGNYLNAEKLKSDVLDMIDFKKRIQKISSTKQAPKFLEISEMQLLWDDIVGKSSVFSVDWLDIIATRLANQGIMITANTLVVISPGNYLEDLANALLQRDVQTIVNYIHWKWIRSVLHSTNKHMRNIEARYNSRFTPKIPYRALQCVENHPMRLALSHLWEHSYLEERYKTHATVMTMDMSEEFMHVIHRNKWLKKKLKKKILRSVDRTEYVIGYPDWHNKKKIINEVYSRLVIGPEYFENVINGFLHMKRELPKLRSLELDVQSFESQVTYAVDKNTLYVTGAAIMESIDFDQPEVLNFARLGQTLATMMTRELHIHDYTYEKKALVNRNRLFHLNTDENYEQRAECFVNQYNNYKLAEDPKTNVSTYINGRDTLAVSISTSTGFSIALQTYRKLVDNVKIRNDTTPALRNFTDTQLFFYGVANYLCENSSPSYLLKRYTKQSHPSSSAIIMGGFSNMEEFATAFKCPARSPMNPDQRCKMWNV